MPKRRDFLMASLATLANVPTLGGAAALAAPFRADQGQATGTWLMPDEGAPHAATWMAFRASQSVWTSRLAGPAQNALALIANMIVRFEPVNMLVGAADMATARQKCDPRVNLVECGLDDLWIRDSGPVFVTNGSSLVGVDFNFNGWGNKQPHGNDARVAARVNASAGLTGVSTSLVLEGGGIEVDGLGTAIITESCVLNGNRSSPYRMPSPILRFGTLIAVNWVTDFQARRPSDSRVYFSDNA